MRKLNNMVFAANLFQAQKKVQRRWAPGVNSFGLARSDDWRVKVLGLEICVLALLDRLTSSSLRFDDLDRKGTAGFLLRDFRNSLALL